MTSVEPTMRIYSGPLSMFGAKAEIAAREKGLDFELIMVPFVSAYEPKHPRREGQSEAAGAGAGRLRKGRSLALMGG